MNTIKKYITIPGLLLFSSGILGQGIYNNGGKIVIGTGVSLTINGTGGNYRNETSVTDGSVDLAGTLIIKGNLTNNVAGSDAFGNAGVNGGVILAGTTAQTIGGTTTAIFQFPNLTVNNPNGIVFTKDAQVNGSMTFSNGLVDIGNNNFTFGDLSVVAGSPSASSMIIATGSGQVQKKWAATGAFTFPVGDNTGTAEYSPVSLDFKSGTFANGAFAGLNLVTSKYNDPLITGSYLNRYWNISQTGITNFSCDAVFKYVTADVTGSESGLSGVRVIPLPVTGFKPANIALHQVSASGLTSFGTFTGGPGSKTLDLKLFLEGPYNTGTSLMNKTLNTNSLVPLAQPFNAAPWNYSGTETLSSVPADGVDWVLVELRQAASPDLATSSTILAKRAAILKSNGSIVDLDGTGPLIFDNSFLTEGNNLYIVVRHRNHLAIMSATGAILNTGVYSYDFTTGLSQAYGGGSGYKQVGSTFAMVSGDVDVDGSIFVSDFNTWAVGFGAVNGYLKADIDMDGSTFVSDYNKWAINFGSTVDTKLKSAQIETDQIKPKYSSGVPK